MQGLKRVLYRIGDKKREAVRVNGEPASLRMQSTNLLGQTNDANGRKLAAGI
jgi:hypothetical protein